MEYFKVVRVKYRVFNYLVAKIKIIRQLRINIPYDNNYTRFRADLKFRNLIYFIRMS